MVTFLAGGTGTPKLLAGADHHFEPSAIDVVANTGDDVELGRLFICPDIDTVLFERAGLIDTETWWGIEDDTDRVHAALQEFASALDIGDAPRYRDDAAQTAGHPLTRWRRFRAVPEFMFLGDRDRAIHQLRADLLEAGQSLTAVTDHLATALGVESTILPMSDDPVASIIHTPDGPMHFQEFWVYHNGEPRVTDVEFRGAESASATAPVLAAIREGPVIIGPSNPVTSLGPLLELDDIRAALEDTPVVAVSPFIEDQVFSGPAADLMRATGNQASTAGVAGAYPFADAFVLDTDDETNLDRPTIRTDTLLDTPQDASRVLRACLDALEATA